MQCNVKKDDVSADDMQIIFAAMPYVVRSEKNCVTARSRYADVLLSYQSKVTLKKVLKRWQKVDGDVASQKADGRLFQARAAATGKVQSQKVEQLIGGARSVDKGVERRQCCDESNRFILVGQQSFNRLMIADLPGSTTVCDRTFSIRQNA